MPLSSQWRAVLAGAVASSAYLLVQALDRRLLPNEYDDLVLWGGIVSAQARRQRILGLAAHYTAGTVLATLYHLLHDRLPSLPGPVRGLLFVSAEHALTFPGAAAVTRVHPAVRRGQLPDLWTRQYLVVETVRHVAFGVTLGLTYAVLTRVGLGHERS